MNRESRRFSGWECKNYRIYERIVVSPRDVWVKEPVAGKKIVSLQSCIPAPTYEKRLIVRGELMK
ncbi:MAG: sortase [Actinobacteria bacterium]|nr:sortase [Actinomycetota bacterium]